MSFKIKTLHLTVFFSISGLIMHECEVLIFVQMLYIAMQQIPFRYRLDYRPTLIVIPPLIFQAKYTIYHKSRKE